MASGARWASDPKRLQFPARPKFAGVLYCAVTVWVSERNDALGGVEAESMIERETVVSRHDPLVTSIDVSTVLGVGNGQFAFNPDVTGFQTLNASYGHPFPLSTLTDWMWHSSPFPEGVDAFRDFEYAYLASSHGPDVPYPLDHPSPASVTDWLRANPHRLDVGQVGLRIMAPGGASHRALTEADLTNVRQKLSLWTGRLNSSFELLGGLVNVTTTVHPDLDAVGWKVQLTPDLDDRLAIRLAFPYGSSNFMSAADWSEDTPGRQHKTTVIESSNRTLRLLRQLDFDSYEVRCDWPPGQLYVLCDGPHAIMLALGLGIHSVDLACLYAPRGGQMPLSAESGWQANKSAATLHALEHGVPSVEAIDGASAASWSAFWRSGAFVDLARESRGDPRALELERRVVLSQWLTRVHSAGALPPQETGLAANSWFGKVRLSQSQTQTWVLAWLTLQLAF